MYSEAAIDRVYCTGLVNAFYHFYLNPHIGEVYNIGGASLANVRYSRP